MNSTTESLEQFYRRTQQPYSPEVRDANISHFNIKRRSCLNRATPHNRRDYYKICLIIGSGIYRRNNQETYVKGPCIIFSHPQVTSSWESVSEEQSGFYCLFNDAFILNSLKQEVKYGSALFNPEIMPLIELDSTAVSRFHHYFSEMELLLSTTYPFKLDMIRHILQLLIHEGARLQQTIVRPPLPRSTDRLVNQFLELLDRQFPVDSPENPLHLLTPAMYADQLNVHVNHLNAMVKKQTGKTTREVIREKIIAEAKKLLLHTSWDAAQIAYSLGFEYPSHFNKYFKQYTGISPLTFRQENLAHLQYI